MPYKLYWYGPHGEVVGETDAAGNTLNEYVYLGNRLIAMLPASANPILYVEDHLGTARVNTTSTGVVCYDADFYPYGGERVPYTDTCTQNNYKFEGKERDAETGNDDFGARYYSNRFGRWLSADWSNVPVAVPYANLTNPQTLNLYSMVADDPESFADLDGHDGFWDKYVVPVLNFIVCECKNAGNSSPAFQQAVTNAAAGVGIISGTAVVQPTSGEQNTKADQLKANQEQGKAFEKEVKPNLESKQTGVVEQLTVKTESGTKTRLDFAGNDKESGKPRLTEAKSSETAPLTPNQTKAFPEIKETGATVVGQGKAGFPGGTKIPPTEVEIIRPPIIE